MTDKTALVTRLIEMLVEFVPSLKSQASAFSADYGAQRTLLRGLMNMHSVNNVLPQEYYKLQDELLRAELAQKELVKADSIEGSVLNRNICLYRGDITTMVIDAIVNPANNTLLGCFQAGHNCIDNRIHSAAGLQLRFECNNYVSKIQRVAKAGSAIITHGFNLPAKYVIHVVGPKVGFNVTDQEIDELSSCYKESLDLCRKNHIKSIAFSCISTDIFGFPNQRAAKIAVRTVNDNLKQNGNDLKVVFVVEDERDYNAYENLLTPHEETNTDDLHPFFNINLF